MNWLIVLLMLLYGVVIVVNFFVEDVDIRAVVLSFCFILVVVISMSIIEKMTDSVVVKSYSIESKIEQTITDGEVIQSDTTYVIRFEK